jgi:LacI family transcriptional regulator
VWKRYHICSIGGFRMTTIKDVARLAGVSVSTVSRVINENGYVGEKSKKQILSAMQELNFSPSSIARGLVSGKTSTIGLLVPDVSNPFFAEVARGTEDAAIESGFMVILCTSKS